MSRLLEIFFNPDPPPLLSSILCWFKNYNPRAVAPTKNRAFILPGAQLMRKVQNKENSGDKCGNSGKKKPPDSWR
jgi:hypothetical protein